MGCYARYARASEFSRFKHILNDDLVSLLTGLNFLVHMQC